MIGGEIVTDHGDGDVAVAEQRHVQRHVRAVIVAERVPMLLGGLP
jgi:hypothetical protein